MYDVNERSAIGLCAAPRARKMLHLRKKIIGARSNPAEFRPAFPPRSASPLDLSLTFAPPNKVTPVRAFWPRSPYYSQDTRKRFSEGLSWPMALVLHGKVALRRVAGRGCGALRRKLGLQILVNARNFIAVN
jgi:hypothetical protein